jgi:hypothetical protein
MILSMNYYLRFIQNSVIFILVNITVLYNTSIILQDTYHVLSVLISITAVEIRPGFDRLFVRSP